MTTNRIASTARIALAAAILLQAAHPTPAQQPAGPKLDLTPVQPESVGFSSERLERLHALMQKEVDQKHFSGIVTLLARHGKIVDYRTYGVRDMETGASMTKDTIFRDFSMTKPVTGVALMILYEQGKWLPSDPISKFIPEFAHLKVFKGVDASGKMILVDPDHAPTMGELLTHTAGFSYGNSGTVVDAMYKDQHVLGSKNLQEMIDKLSTIPLLYQPGTKWIYSMSMDIEGYIIEKLSGQSLPDFMHDQIFAPLGMRDAGFYVPEEKRDRLATNYKADADGKLVANAPANAPAGSGQRIFKEPTMPSGGGGLVSTTEDYYRFSQMFLNHGQLNGVRILAPSSIQLMDTNHIPVSMLTGEYHIGTQFLRPGFGYGYNGAVEYDPQQADLPDGKGTYVWGGAAGTWFWIDPTNDVVFVGMIQLDMSNSSPNLEYMSRALVYQALVDPAK
jgi:CubicO group peptidase (beta-lactamase class C family)